MIKNPAKQVLNEIMKLTIANNCIMHPINNRLSTNLISIITKITNFQNYNYNPAIKNTIR